MYVEEKYKILIIDDDRFLLESLTRSLFDKGYDSQAAINGYDGRIKFEAMLPDLVLMDLHMPGMDGLESSRLLQQIGQSIRHEFHLAYLTADGRRSIVEKALRQGAGDFIVKPFTVSEFLERIEGFRRKYLQNRKNQFFKKLQSYHENHKIQQ